MPAMQTVSRRRLLYGAAAALYLLAALHGLLPGVHGCVEERPDGWVAAHGAHGERPPCGLCVLLAGSALLLMARAAGFVRPATRPLQGLAAEVQSARPLPSPRSLRGPPRRLSIHHAI